MPLAAVERRTAPAFNRRALTMIVAAVVLSAPLAAQAQIAEHLFKAAIDKFGGGCTSITKTRPLGNTSGGNTLVAAECSNGGKHVLMIYPDNTVSYMSTCSTFKAKTGISCFARN